jgi:acetolactate synthase-1/2/3 large subunit
MKLSDYTMAFLADQGVKHVFMLPGGGAMHLNDSLGRCPGLEFVAMQHEQAAAIAAEAHARVTNRLSACLVTTGPGGTNAVTGVSAAWLDSTPVLFLSGQVKRPDLKGGTGLRQLGVQETDIVSIVTPITKYAVTVVEPATIRYHLEKAAYLARIGRPGPVWIDVPLDVQVAEIEPSQLAAFIPNELKRPWEHVPMLALARQAIRLLNDSERPVILVGNGLRLAGGEALFQNLVDQLNIPVLTTRLGVDLLPANHPLCFGMPGGIASRAANFTLQNCDFLLILGARLDMALIAYAPERLARGAKKVMVNIDPAEIRKLGPIIDVAVEGDANLFLESIQTLSNEVQTRNREHWISRCRDWQVRYPFVSPEHLAERRGISLYAFSDILAEELVEGDIVLPGSAGFVAEIFLTAFKCKPRQRVFHNKGTGSMGLSQPAAIGACLAGGNCRTIAIDGDGGFTMNIQELETVRRLKLPIKFFVINNGGYASIRNSQRTYFGRLTGADETSGLSLPDYVKVAESYGISARRLSNPETLRDDLRDVLELEGPVVCEVIVMADEPRVPRVASAQRSDGSIVSKPLEDMYPFLERREFEKNMIVPILAE